jgi:hypothetical protein
MRYILVLSAITLVACNKVERSNCPDVHNNIQALEIVGNYSLDAGDNNYRYTSIKYIGYSNAQHELAIGYKEERKILLVTLSESGSKIRKTIQLPREGEGSVAPFDDFIYINADSIVLMASESYEIALIDTAGVLKRKWDLKRQQAEPFGIGQFMPDIKPPAHTLVYNKEDKMVYFNVSHNIEEPYNPKYYHFPLIGGYDLKNEKLAGFYGNYDAYYRNKIESVFEWQFPFIIQDSHYIITYPTLNHLWTSALGNVCRRSTSFKEVEGLNFDASFQERNQMWRLSSRYLYMRYNPYRNEYIVVVKHAAPEQADPVKFQFLESEWSIMVLNESFNTKYEVNFPASTYNFNWVLPTPKGVLISRDSDYNPADREEFIEFEEFKFSDLE